MDSEVEVIIPSYNGKKLLEQHLPELFLAESGFSTTIVVDGGNDDTVEFLQHHYPKIRLIINSTNLGFVKSVNLAVSSSTAKYVVLLNNDVSPKENFLKYSLSYFSDPKVFAVSFNEKDSSWPFVDFHFGKLQYRRALDKSQSFYTAWASGGSAIFKKAIWDHLGGFDPIYSPGYWEDIDLGWRAWKSGYKIIWAPEPKVLHQHESTFKNLNANFVATLKEVNEFVFNWKNFTQLSYRLNFLCYSILRFAKHPGYIKILLAAIPKIRKISLTTPQVISDDQVFAKVNKPIL